MPTIIHVNSPRQSVADAAFSLAADGHVLFGFAGRSRDPILVDAVTRKTVTIHDYLMERGVVYSVRLAVADGRTSVVIADVAPDRVDSVCWFAQTSIGLRPLRN